MAREYEDSVQDVATSTGTGAFVMAGTPPQTMRPFSVHTVGATFEYKAFAGAQWEIGDGAWDGTSIARTPRESSNGNALVNFTAAPTVWEIITASTMRRVPVDTYPTFSQSIPLTQRGTAWMTATTVAGALTFTPAANAVRGALVYLRLTADGTNAPNFSAFKEWGGSSGYDNRTGIVNQIQFFCDGVDNWFTASQAVGAVAVAPAATAVTLIGPASGVVSTASTNFTVGVSPVGGIVTGTVVATVSSSVPGDTITPNTINITNGTPGGTFTVTGSSTGARTISVTNNGGLTNPTSITYAVTAAPTQTVTVATPATQTVGTPFNVTGTYANGTPTALDYRLSDDTAGQWTQVTTATISGGNFSFSVTPISASAGRTISVRDRTTLVPGTSGTYVVNAAAASSPRLINLVSLTESAAEPWVYTGTNKSYGTTHGGTLNMSRPVGGDCSYAQTISGLDTSSEPMMGVTTSATPVAFGSLAYCFYAALSNTAYAAFTNGTSKTVTNTISRASGDIMRLRFSGTTLYAEVARAASPTVFQEVCNWAGVPTTAYHFQSLTDGTAVMSNLTTVGLV